MGTPDAGSRRCPCSGRGRTSGGDARRGGVGPGTGCCPTRRGLDSGHRQHAGLGRKSAEVKVVADEAVGGEWGTDGGGFWAVSSRLRCSGSSRAEQGKEGGQQRWRGRGGLGAPRRTLASDRRLRGRRQNLGRAHGKFRSTAGLPLPQLLRAVSIEDITTLCTRGKRPVHLK
jgi:hypothetical protein